jgi:RNA polymerase subunit RPABC4/transcription elongation factor Spt4
VYCPDCGRKSREDEDFCPVCGYPLGKLRERLAAEEQVAMGWAQRVLGIKPVGPEPPKEPSLVSFTTGEETRVEKPEDEKGLLCERCKTRVQLGTICPKCGDRLPVISDDDPYLYYVFTKIWRMLFAPRYFALTFPYPVAGGTLQPLLYPGIFIAFFVLSLPFSRPEGWIEEQNVAGILVPTFVAFLACILGMPLLMHLTVLLTNSVCVLLGGTGSYRRTIRVASAGVIWLAIYGTLRNLALYGFYLARIELRGFIDVYFPFSSVTEPVQIMTPFLMIGALVLIGWQYAWTFGGLHRLNWWKTIIMTFSTYVAILWWVWIYIIIILPLRASGLLY